MPGKRFAPNPHSKGHEIEYRDFYNRDGEFQAMCKVVPFVLGGEPTARAWWQKAVDAAECLVAGVPSKRIEDRTIPALTAGDRKFIPGDTADTQMEARAYRHEGIRQRMYKIIPRGQIPHFVGMVWWEVPDATNPNDGIATLCIGIRPTEEAKSALSAGDDLDTMTKAQLLTHAAVKCQLRDVNDSMEEGEIISRIRAATAAKNKPKAKKESKEPVTV